MPMIWKKEAKKNEYEVRRYITLEVEIIEKVPKEDYTGPNLDPELKREMEEAMKQKLGVDSVTIKKVKDFLGE